MLEFLADYCLEPCWVHGIANLAHFVSALYDSRGPSKDCRYEITDRFAYVEYRTERSLAWRSLPVPFTSFSHNLETFL